MRRGLLAFLLFAACLFAAAPLSALPISVDDPKWYEFKFAGTGAFATSGIGTVQSSGGNSQFAPDPPWTFSGAAVLTVTDAFEYGDIFEIFDSGSSIGFTSAVSKVAGGSLSDPALALLDNKYSHGSFVLGAGNHSLTFKPFASPYGGGAAFFKVASVPEPLTVLLLGIGLVGIAAVGKRKLTK